VCTILILNESIDAFDSENGDIIRLKELIKKILRIETPRKVMGPKTSYVGGGTYLSILPFEMSP
jgi:hypothetical protein